MRELSSKIGLTDGMRVLDLGGQPHIWDFVDKRLHITILNLPGVAEAGASSRHELRFVEGDATHVEGLDGERFDLVFSNSVIEHVGDGAKQRAFASEVRRLGRAYWVQTPADVWPIEPHCGMPLWWHYPDRLREYFIDEWRKKLPDWTDMVAGTTVLSRDEMIRLFPDGEIHTETMLGIPKSYVAYRTPSGIES